MDPTARRAEAGRARAAAAPAPEPRADRTARRRRPVLVLPGWLDGPMTSCHLVIGAAGMLLAIGLVMVFSASAIQAALDDRPAWRPGVDQLVFAAIGLVALLVAVRLPTAVIRRWIPIALLVVLGLLALVLVPGVGQLYNGSRAWFDLGFTNVQPSEVAKLVFALWGAHMLALRVSYLTVRGLLVPLLPVFLVICALLMLEPDFGATVTMGLVLAGLLLAGGAPWRVWAGLGAVAVTGVLLLVTTSGYRMARWTSFLNPEADPTDSGFQAIRGFYALATGGFWGVGLGNSAMKWKLLPEAESDYIFAIIGEEMGFLGCLVVIALYGVLAHAGFRIARRSADRFVQLSCVAITVWLVGQAAMNMGYVVGLGPVTGVTLPLISAGGTSLVLTLFIVGLLIRFARSEPEAIEYQRRRASGRLVRLLLPVPAHAVDPIRPRSRRHPVPGPRPARSGQGSGARTVVRVPPAASSPGTRAPRERVPAPRERRAASDRPRAGDAHRQPPPRARAAAPDAPRRPR